jgi:tRNA(Met) cytidine acetyltransferase
LRARGPLAEHRLTVPIRFAPDDPVERTVARLFAFDAEPSAPEDGPLELETVPAPRLAADEPLLRAVVALLGWAHHRTTPGDLVRLLDAPNLRLVVARQGGAVVGVNLIALEGGLDPSAAHAAARARLRGQGLADTLATHSGRPEAATFALRRSVRIATHPDRRRAGIARALTEHVHASEPAELFGTLFGATAELVRFRRALGYEVARVGAGRGARSGDPSVVMLRPVSARAAALLAALRADLAWNWPLQRALLAREEPLSAALVSAIEEGLPPAVEPDDAALAERLAFYVGSAQPLEACVGFVACFARRHPERLAALPPSDRALVAGRVLELAGWAEVAASAGLPIDAAHRRMRQAVRAMVG